MKDISVSINKVDNDAKISGQEVYVNDIFIEDIYYAKTYRANIVCGKIKSVTLPDLPKDYYIVDAMDIPGENYVKIIFDDLPVFAKEVVHYYGEPILLVVGKDKKVITDIMEQIKVDYVEEVPRFDYSDSAIHYDYTKGNPASVKEDHQLRTIQMTYHTGYQEHVYIEPQGMIGIYEEGKITLIGSIQCPYYVKNAVMQAMGDLDETHLKIRVKQASTGGAFGGKEEFPSHLACQLAVAVKKIKKPIKLIYERGEDIEFTTKRHPSTIDFEARVSDRGEIRYLKAKVGIDAGAYIGLSGVVLQRAMLAASGAYVFDTMEVSGDVFRTNTVPTGAFRGFGAPQMIFAIEMFIHHIGKEINNNPLELRRRYLAKQWDATSTGGSFREPIIMNSMIDKALEMSRYEEKLQEFLSFNTKGEEKVYKGIGMSWFLHGCGFTGSGEQKHIKAIVQLRKNVDDTVSVLLASVDMGQGIKTTMRKIVATELDIPIERVLFDNPDTDFVPDSGPTVASRTIMIVGGLLHEATKELREKWVLGEEVLVEKRYKQPEYILWDENKLQGDAYPAYSWGINIVEVEVSKVTYEVSLKGSWSVYDVGKAIDERIIMGQAEGGLLQALGYGMLEVMNHSKGRLLQKNITDYIIPTAKDSVAMETILMDNPYALGPYGAKGAGELTLIGGAPAVALAIENAISRKITKIPVTPEYIMELINHESN